MRYRLPALPYPLEALAPVISREALDLHHGVHHQAYVDKLNAALVEHAWNGRESVDELLRNLESLPDPLREPVRNFGGGHSNHSLFWETLTPSPSQPTRHLAKLIDRDFGNLAVLRHHFDKEAAGLFGSGWVFLVWDPAPGALDVVALPNQDSPWSQARLPLLACDVWEHAHYLDYRQRRDAWVRDWWHLVDWRQVEKRLDL